MNKPRLIYFDAPVSRGEECRLALHLAGLDFDDVRVAQADWPALKPATPFGGLPVLELPGLPPLGHPTPFSYLSDGDTGSIPKTTSRRRSIASMRQSARTNA
jgi:hypothetical protein